MSAKPGPVNKEPDDLVDLSDPASVAQRNKSLKGREARVRNGLKLVLGHPDSRLWLHSFLEAAKPFNDPFTGNSQTFYNCGQQSLGKRLVAQLLDEFLDEYVLMMREAKDA